MRAYRWITLVLMVVSPGMGIGQEEETEGAFIEKENILEWNGNLDVKYTLFHMHESSPFYKLQFPDSKPSSSFLTQYRLEPYMNAEYKTSELGFHLRTHATYFSDADASLDIFEAYGNYSPSFNTTLQAGKRVYNWGKGYAFNPVGFINPVKDPENPELAQAGLLSANVEYVKSLSPGALQNISFVFVVIPSTKSTSNRFSALKHTDIAMRASLLLWDTDIDVIAFHSIQKPRQVGLDIARNLSENMEAHAEISYRRNTEKYTIVNNSVISSFSNDIAYLIGIRYLHRSNTTLIVEYYHNESGFSPTEYDSYNRFLASGTQNADPMVLQELAKVNHTYFRGSNLMKDYLYLKLTKPEPFDWLYFTPSLFTIFNISDRSFLISMTMNYKPATNIEFILWPSLVSGRGDTEYGSKAFRQKVEMWMRVFF